MQPNELNLVNTSRFIIDLSIFRIGELWKTLEPEGVARIDFRHLPGPVFELSDSLAVGRFGIYYR